MFVSVETHTETSEHGEGEQKLESYPEKVKALCGSCMKVTNHAVLAVRVAHGVSEDREVRWTTRYQIIECQGCEDISFREFYTCSEDIHPLTGEEVETVRLYPERTETRKPMEGYEAFPMRTRRIYLETLSALNNQSLILAAIGLRAVIESICLEQGVQSINLERKIDELADKGFRTYSQGAERLA